MAGPGAGAEARGAALAAGSVLPTRLAALPTIARNLWLHRVSYLGLQAGWREGAPPRGCSGSCRRHGVKGPDNEARCRLYCCCFGS